MTEQVESPAPGRAKRLYVLDYGLFQVHENERVIGIQGYAIETEAGDTILVDTGFPAAYADDIERASKADRLETFGRLRQLDRDNLAAGQLARIRIAPADIRTLVLTHGDIDHIGGIADFPNATIVAGRAERALERPRYFGDRRPIAWPDRPYRLVDGDEEIAPGMTLLATPGHSPGHLSVLLRLPETGAVLLTGDAICRASEPDEGYAGAWDEAQAVASAARLLAIADRERATIIYGHDPAQWPTLRKAPAFYS
jgi:N-acyl homoserine lactone hydrolase